MVKCKHKWHFIELEWSEDIELNLMRHGRFICEKCGLIKFVKAKLE